MFIGDHYWLADDGRLWGSKNQMQVTADDPDYIAWKANNVAETVWPREGGVDAGAQTDAALQEVVGPYGWFANLTFYSGDARLRKINTGIRILSITPKTFRSDMLARSQVNNAKQFFVADPQMTVLPWQMQDGSYIEVTQPNIDLMLLSMGGFAEECFSAEEQLAIDIAAGTVTTRAEVDARYEAIPINREGPSEVLRARKPKGG